MAAGALAALPFRAQAAAAQTVPPQDGSYLAVAALSPNQIWVIPAGNPVGGWNLSGSQWGWNPASPTSGIDAAHQSWFHGLLECKLTDGGASLLVSSKAGGSIGGFAKIDVASQAPVFYGPGGVATHAVEQLPDGNLAWVSTVDALATDPGLIGVASTDPAVSQFPDHVVQNTYPGLVSRPHGLVWDPQLQRLWANGNDGVHALIYDFNTDNPHLALDPAIGTIRFPNGASGGHDLYPVYGQRQIFVTTTYNVFTLDPDTLVMTPYLPSKSGQKAWGVSPLGFGVSNLFSSYAFSWTPGIATMTPHQLPKTKLYKVRVWTETLLAA